MHRRTWRAGLWTVAADLNPNHIREASKLKFPYPSPSTLTFDKAMDWVLLTAKTPSASPIGAPMLLSKCIATPPVMFGPNITGGIGAKGGVAWQEPYGCFITGGSNGYVVASIDTETALRALGINASLSSDVYSGNSVQPKALNCLPCIRFWYKREL